jgi:hypothetical protein
MTTEITITTNRRWRNLTYRSDVPAKVLADQFAHLGEDDGFDGFFQYRGYWYHTSDFSWIQPSARPEETPLAGWDGYHGDSFYSGVVIRLSKDGEQYMVGTYLA